MQRWKLGETGSLVLDHIRTAPVSSGAYFMTNFIGADKVV